MAIGPGNKLTTTGIMNQKPDVVAPADLSALGQGQAGAGQGQAMGGPTQAQVTPPNSDFPEATPMELEFAERAKSLTDEDQATLQSVLSPSVRAALEKIIPEFKDVMDAYGSNEPNIIFPLSSVVRFAITRYGGQDEQEAVDNFIADVTSLQDQQMDQNNVPPGAEQPTNETAGLMTSPQNMETV